MRVWIDADACPKAAKDQVVKFALKRRFEVLLVAGQAQIKPAYSCVRLIVVPSGPDAADDYLVEHALPGELVICSDVPLADRLVKKGVAALDPRGREFDERNMGDKLAVRNLFTELREQGQVGGGQPPYGERDKQAFANSLDRILTRLQRQTGA
ncbi:YaiI/YqxD family protein [Pseudomonas sp. EA_35y_Pfl2_R111]|uniref:YaiI/YqxD family protein n=1 Tax=Pseudomonas sp. EA_35y_Pfl2_R111 TaxID=3088689 RepID=UPI0030DA1722